MTKQEARQVLHATENSNQLEIQASFEQRYNELAAKLIVAPNARSAERYRTGQAQLEEARDLLLSDAPEAPIDPSRPAAELTPDEALRLEQEREKKMTLLASLGEPVTSAPSMFTMNGVGFTVFGSMRDPDIAPQYFVNHGFCFLFPLTPIAAYLVTSNDGRNFRFHKKYTHDDLRKIYGNEKIQRFWISKF